MASAALRIFPALLGGGGRGLAGAGRGLLGGVTKTLGGIGRGLKSAVSGLFGGASRAAGAAANLASGVGGALKFMTSPVFLVGMVIVGGVVMYTATQQRAAIGR